MNRIIVPLDGSKRSERAIPFAETFARTFDSRIQLVHVLEDPVAFNLLPSLIIPDRLAAEQYLRDVREQISNDIEVSSYVLRGKPVKNILDLATDGAGAMIVMSSHSRRGIDRLVLGNVADKVLRRSMVPVVLVRSSSPPVDGTFQSLLVPLDKTTYSETALSVATDLAQRSDATLALVHVCEPFWVSPYASNESQLSYVGYDRERDVDRESLETGRYYLDRLAREIRSKGIRSIWEVRFGKPADEILRAAETTGADLIVMATHDRHGIRRLALGSVTSEVLQRGKVPVLAIPPHAIGNERATIARLLSTQQY